LDKLLALVTAKDGEVDWIMMPQRTLDSYKQLLRAQGGTPGGWIMQLEGVKRPIHMYEDIPIFVNNFLSTVETANGAALTGGALTSVWAGVWDDGTQKTGLSAIHPIKVPAGIDVKYIGEQEAKDSAIWRVKQYANLANFNRRGLARLTSINN
jgi:hypothetical protein